MKQRVSEMNNPMYQSKMSNGSGASSSRQDLIDVKKRIEKLMGNKGHKKSPTDYDNIPKSSANGHMKGLASNSSEFNIASSQNISKYASNAESEGIEHYGRGRSGQE